MEPSTVDTASSSSPNPDFYIWSVPDRAVSVWLRFDVIDRLNVDIMQGFGSVPRRGAEVGGVLLGRVREGDPTVVSIEDFETVPCEHRHGPSYLLSDADRQRLAAALERWRPTRDQPLAVVGFFRSNTREKLSLTEEDVALFAEHCFDPARAFLLVKPFAARPGIAGFFLWEDGRIRKESTRLEFPFQRRALGGGVTPPRREEAPAQKDARPEPAEQATAEPGPGGARKRTLLRLFPGRVREKARPEPSPGEPPSRFAVRSPGPSPIEERTDPRTQAVRIAPPVADDAFSSAPRRRNSLLAILPLSFLFLILGVVLGFQAALRTKINQTLAPQPDAYALQLMVTGRGENLEVNWNRQSPAMAAARRGVLHIWDGETQRDVELDSAALRNDNVIYRRLTGTVKFRLEVFLNDRVSVSELKEVRAESLPPGGTELAPRP